MAESIKDRVAIIGMGSTKFGENFEMSFLDMAVEAAYEAYQDAGIDPKEVQAGWLGTFAPDQAGGFMGQAGSFLATAISLKDRPVTRVTNYCATGMEAIRNAAFAVAAGVFDIVIAVGCEKMRDVGPRESLIKQIITHGHPIIGKGQTAPGMFAMMATVHFKRFGTTKEDLAKVAVKNHYNGVRNPKAHFRKEIKLEQALKAPLISDPLGLFDCCPTTDGAAAAILTTPALAKQIKKNGEYILVKGMGLSVVTDTRYFEPGNEYTGFHATQNAAKLAYKDAGIKDPVKELDCAEVHDCFTITEILNYEDLGLCKKGEGGAFIREGRSALSGDMPVNTSGGLKSCGHPIGASGVRMTYEIYQQLLGRAGDRQIKDAELGLIHNLGGPGSVACVAIYGR